MAKKTKKAKSVKPMKKASKKEVNCNCAGGCGGILPLAIIALIWWKPAVLWAQITITVLATLIFMCSKKNTCN